MRFPNPVRFIRSMWRSFLRWRRGDRVIASPEVQSVRKGKCLICPHYSPVARQCLLCTCFTDLKVLFADESCPDKRWKKETLQ